MNGPQPGGAGTKVHYRLRRAGMLLHQGFAPNPTYYGLQATGPVSGPIVVFADLRPVACSLCPSLTLFHYTNTAPHHDHSA